MSQRYVIKMHTYRSGAPLWHVYDRARLDGWRQRPRLVHVARTAHDAEVWIVRRERTSDWPVVIWAGVLTIGYLLWLWWSARP